MSDDPFAELLGRVRAGDAGAAAELVRRYEPLIRREVRLRLLLQHLPAERIVPEVALTNEADARVRSEVAQAIADLNALVRHHNLVVTATSLHLAIATLDGLIDVARAAPPRDGGR